MGRSVYLFAGPADYRAFSEYARSLNLRFYPFLIGQPEEQLDDNPADYPFAYLSIFPRDQLHPYGKDMRIGPATDPLIELVKPYFKDQLLVMGRLHCSNNNPDRFAVTKPLFTKLAQWIRRHWEQLPTKQYIGPEAKSLSAQGAMIAFFPPTVEVKHIILPPKDTD